MHPTIYAEVAPEASKPSSGTQASLSDVIAMSTKYSSSSAHAKKMNSTVIYNLAKDAVPLSTVEKPGFRHNHGIETKSSLPATIKKALLRPRNPSGLCVCHNMTLQNDVMNQGSCRFHQTLLLEHVTCGLVPHMCCEYHVFTAA